MAEYKPYGDDAAARATMVHAYNPTATRRKGPTSKEWLVVSESGDSHFEVVEKQAIMRRTGLPARDLRVLDPALSYPSTILGRERAIVVNLEHIKAIVTAKEVLMINSVNPLFVDFVRDLQAKLSSKCQATPNVDIRGKSGIAGDDTASHDCSSRGHRDDQSVEHEDFPDVNPSTTARNEPLDTKVLPFEFRALEACLESSCRCLEIELRDELEHLLDDDNDMSEMYLTEKFNDQSVDSPALRDDVGDYVSDTDNDRDIEEPRSAKYSSFSFSKPNVEQLEMLLEAYFAQIDGILQKLSTLSEYVGDTEDYINIMLDDKQNQLLQMGVILSTAIMILNAGIVVVGLFGMNIHISIYEGESSTRFWETTFGVAGGCVALYIIAFVWGMKRSLFAL